MSNRRSALGRGLGALIPGAGSGASALSQPSETAGSEAPANARLRPASGPDRGPALLPVAEIDPNPDQPRRQFDAKSLDQLADSIKRHGVLQPVVVRRVGDRYELIVGERRWRATRAAGLRTIPAVVADVDPSDRLELAIVENVQRHDLNPIELAYAYRELSQHGVTQEEIGRRVSKDRSSVANHLRLLELSREIQGDVESGSLTMGHAKALLQIANPERRLHLRNRVVSERLSVRETEQLGREIAGPIKRSTPRKPRKTSTVLDPNLAPLVEDLQARLQSRVRIVGGAERGRIEIEYFGSEDLQRIVALMGPIA